ncbi:uncharacterized protein LOC116424662 [Nomia melanderi]|uniref:uncharacterized protein LOC116424662 n=1 Tax=Nomia melanderi TaxID=2448451 RepID=UPI0013047585|nr:uncharacterized protein LOC116424662 [Nomia melanderi]
MEYADNQQMNQSYFSMIWSTVASVGWYIVAVVFSLWYASPYIREKYTSWKRRREEQEYAAKYHKNPDLLQERLVGFEASREKMQQEYYQKSMLAQENKKAANSLSRSSKGDYPLMGHNSRRYCPPVRSCCGKDRCG